MQTFPRGKKPPNRVPKKTKNVPTKRSRYRPLRILIVRHLPKHLLHLFLERRSPGTVHEPLHDGEVPRGLVDELVARVVPRRPFLQPIPAPAHAHLPDARLGNPSLGRVARGVVGVAEDVLAQRVGAVGHVGPRPALRRAVPELRERDVDRPLCLSRPVS